MKLNELKSDLEMYDRFILKAEQEIKDLEDKYGTGVRPGWVSAEMSTLWERLNRLYVKSSECEIQIKEKENEQIS